MHGDSLYSIGELADRTGLTVKAIRFYSDRGIVSPVGRSPVGHRRYDADALARLELLSTLRELGVDLPTIRKVLERELTLAEVAAAHAEALAVQIRTLRLRRAVLTAVAGRGSTAEEIDLMHRLARLSEAERGHLIDGLLDAALGGLDGAPAFAAVRRTLTPALPEDPEPGQIEAWVELAELAQDPDFRASLRRTAEDHAAECGGTLRRDIVAEVRHRVRPALLAGVGPADPLAEPIVAALTGCYAGMTGTAEDAGPRLLARLERADDRRRERYTELLAVINGWPAPEPLAPVLDWTLRALRARGGGTGGGTATGYDEVDSQTVTSNSTGAIWAFGAEETFR